MVGIGMKHLNRAMAKHGKRYELREDEDGKPYGVEITTDAQGKEHESVYWPDEKKEADIVAFPSFRSTHDGEVEYDA